ncbi:hypothetical protein BJV74DRAFT_548145 [Russula compacta]|nr:hypothetical protein BJV74DRAFT_548145 [Russula compacta]
MNLSGLSLASTSLPITTKLAQYKGMPPWTTFSRRLIQRSPQFKSHNEKSLGPPSHHSVSWDKFTQSKDIPTLITFLHGLICQRSPKFKSHKYIFPSPSRSLSELPQRTKMPAWITVHHRLTSQRRPKIKSLQSISACPPSYSSRYGNTYVGFYEGVYCYSYDLCQHQRRLPQCKEMPT